MTTTIFRSDRVTIALVGALLAADGLGIGHGHGPVHHFHALWPLLEKPR